MDSREFLYDSEFDKAVRRYGAWPYFALYMATFFVSFAFGLPAPFEVSLFANHERTMSASVWAFVVSYPLFHVGMKSRVFTSFNSVKGRAKACLSAVVILLVCWAPMHFTLTDEPVTRTGRALANSSITAAVLQFALSATASLGIFVLLEPLRARLARWL